MNKAKTEDTKDKARTKLLAIPKAEYKDGKNSNIPAKPKKLGQEDITKRATIHKVRTKDKEEAIKDVNGCKRPIVMDREGKIKDNERSKTKAGREARDRNKVQELRDTRDKDDWESLAKT